MLLLKKEIAERRFIQMNSLYFQSKTFNERIWHTKKIKRYLSLLKLYANFVMHVEFYLVIFLEKYLSFCHSLSVNYCNIETYNH